MGLRMSSAERAERLVLTIKTSHHRDSYGCAATLDSYDGPSGPSIGSQEQWSRLRILGRWERLTDVSVLWAASVRACLPACSEHRDSVIRAFPMAEVANWRVANGSLNQRYSFSQNI